VLVTQLEAKKAGYADVVYLDAKTDTCVGFGVLGSQGRHASASLISRDG